MKFKKSSCLSCWEQLCLEQYEQIQTYPWCRVSSSSFLSLLPETIVASSSESSSSKTINLGKYKEKDVLLKEGRDGHRYLVYEKQNISLSKHLKYSNRPLDNIKLEEFIPILQKGWIIRKVTKDIFIRKGVRGKSDYIIFKKYHRDKCVTLHGFPEEDYLTCPTSKIMKWIADQNENQNQEDHK